MKINLEIFLNYHELEGERILSKPDDYLGSNDMEFKTQLEKKYTQLFGDKKIDFSIYDNPTLQGLWKVNHTMAFQCLEKRYLYNNLEEIFEILKKRNIEKENYIVNKTTYNYVENIFGLYILFGDFSKANSLKDEYQSILKSEVIPIVYDDTSIMGEDCKLYKISDDGRSISLISVNIKEGPKIIFISNPGCYFSKQAIKLISATPELMNIFKKYATIIIPFRTSMSYLNDMAVWNKNNPELEHFIYPHQDKLQGCFNKFSFSSAPKLYFIKDNKIVYQIRGFDPRESKYISDVYNGIKQVGIEI